MQRSWLFLLCAAAMLSSASLAEAAFLSYRADLSGPAEAPPNASPGTGIGWLDIDTVAHTFRIQAVFSGLLGTTTASHIHGPTAVAGAGAASVMTQLPSFAGFPLGVTGGNFDSTFDMTLASTWRPGFITLSGGTTAGAELAFINAVADGKAYLNIHTTAFPGGEIRGFFQPVPEPATMSLMLVGSAGLVFLRRRKQPA